MAPQPPPLQPSRPMMGGSLAPAVAFSSPPEDVGEDEIEELDEFEAVDDDDYEDDVDGLLDAAGAAEEIEVNESVTGLSVSKPAPSPTARPAARGADRGSSHPPATQRGVAPGERSFSPPPFEMSEEAVEQALADADSYRRAQLHERAARLLRDAIRSVPQSLELRVALRDTLLEAERTDEAVDEMLAIAGVYIDALDNEGAAQALQHVLTVDPTNGRAIELLQDLGYDVIDENEQGRDSAFAIELPQERQYQPYDGDPLPSYELDLATPPPPAAPAAGRSRRISEIDDPFGSEAPLPSYPLGSEDDSQASYRAVERPGMLGSPRSMGDTAARGNAASSNAASSNGGVTHGSVTQGAVTVGANLAATGSGLGITGALGITGSRNGVTGENGADSLSFSAESPTRTGASRAGVNPELEEALDEAEFFASRGLLDDARAVLQEQLSRLPNHPLILDRLAELDGSGDGMQSGAREMPRDAGLAFDKSFDIAASLDALEGFDGPTAEASPYMDGDHQVDVEEVFAKFKEGVAKQISVDDAQAHYDLAVAYKEMGLLEDAIREFEIAARDPRRECVCQSMVGMIHVERGNLNEAIDAFMRGLHAHHRTPEEEVALSYELGQAYESKRMSKDALAYYQRCAKREPNFRDVQDRIRRLSAGNKGAMRAVAVNADDEFDRAFDDLLSGGKS
jgi:tetratricopeptide (TPR) repeat protein